MGLFRFNRLEFIIIIIIMIFWKILYLWKTE